MNGPKEGYNWGGIKIKSIVGLAPCVGVSLNAVIFCSLGDVSTIGFTTCKGYIEYADEFFEIL